MTHLENSWKNAGSEVFEKQLALNKRELASSYPTHWLRFIGIIKKVKPTSMLDIGCGCGAFHELCWRHFPEIRYHGIDYSEDAIKLAKETWSSPDSFSTQDYRDLTSEQISKYDLIHMGAFLDVLPNADEALDFILGLQPKSVLIGRMKVTLEDSFTRVYKAYDAVDTVEYYHNSVGVHTLTAKHKYSFTQYYDTFYMEKLNDME